MRIGRLFLSFKSPAEVAQRFFLRKRSDHLVAQRGPIVGELLQGVEHDHALLQHLETSPRH